MELYINRLKECREKIGISKQEAARRIGISQPAYLRYESGDRKPSLQTTKEIARVLNTSVDYLVGNSDDNNPTLIEISKDDNSELFRIIELCSQMDEVQQKRSSHTSINLIYDSLLFILQFMLVQNSRPFSALGNPD